MAVQVLSTDVDPTTGYDGQAIRVWCDRCGDVWERADGEHDDHGLTSFARAHRHRHQLTENDW